MLKTIFSPNILSWSSILNKKTKFLHILYSQNVDVACISEIFLKSDHFFRADWFTQCGGMAFIIQNSITHPKLHDPTSLTSKQPPLSLKKAASLVSICCKPSRKKLSDRPQITSFQCKTSCCIRRFQHQKYHMTLWSLWYLSSRFFNYVVRHPKFAL